ncbi:hypothetical protein [Nocardia sp. CA-290969]|uniref:hypothetical protein n=1 Tax=Nocardia sp. CA-290969 TaxID=3239986 RepID=UPI003D939B56
MTWARAWAVSTGVAILLIPLVVIAVRVQISMGWIFAFVFIYGAPIWLGCFAAQLWIALELFTPDSAFHLGPRSSRRLVYGLLWVYLATLTFFCLFMSDGGDADDWQSPAGHFLGVDGYNGNTPEFLWRAEAVAMPSLLVSWGSLFGAAVVYGVTVLRYRRSRTGSAAR